jgi:hypothetical protein
LAGPFAIAALLALFFGQPVAAVALRPRFQQLLALVARHEGQRFDPDGRRFAARFQQLEAGLELQVFLFQEFRLLFFLVVSVVFSVVSLIGEVPSGQVAGMAHEKCPQAHDASGQGKSPAGFPEGLCLVGRVAGYSISFRSGSIGL